jgi:two-component system chemotaxis response regulator CheY
MNILIVDDSSTVRAVIKRTLGIAGVQVDDLRQAANGQEAIDILRNEHMDIVFTDINMPVMGGVEMIERIRADDTLGTTPIVVVSTEGSATRIAELQALGVQGYLRKPFTPEAIRRVVDDLGEVPHENSRT